MPAPRSYQNHSATCSSQNHLGGSKTPSHSGKPHVNPISSPLPPTPARYDITSYKPVKIKALKVGPAEITFTARVVNLVHRAWSRSEANDASSGEHSKATGYLKLVLTDGTGVVVVKHFFVSGPPQGLNLGSLVSIHATHISPQDPKAKLRHEGLFISIIPEQDPTVALAVLDGIQQNSNLCRTPLDYRPGIKQIRGGVQMLYDVMNDVELKETEVLRALVVVKSISPARTISFRKDDNERSVLTVDVIVRDTTYEAVLSLWDYCVSAVKEWRVGKTVLLLTRPLIKDNNNGKQRIVLGPETTVEVDPEFPASSDLKLWSAAKVREEVVIRCFPEDVFDLEAFRKSAQRIKFTLGDMNEFIRAGENETYIGYFSLILFDVNLTKLYLANMLFGADCCGIPIHANSTEEMCQSCGTTIRLLVNPAIVKSLADDTGSLAGNELIWPEQVWERLLGRSSKQLVYETIETIKAIEYSLMYCRMTLLMGWSPEVGRLVVCEIHV